MEFKDRIRQLRLKRELSYAQIAAMLEKSESAIRMWESGKSKPDADTLIMLAEYFDCTTDYLLGLSIYKNNDYEQHMSSVMDSLSDGLAALPTVIRDELIEILNNTIRMYKRLGKFAELQDEYIKYLFLVINSLCASSMVFQDVTLFCDESERVHEDILRQQALTNQLYLYSQSKSSAISSLVKLYDIFDNKMKNGISEPIIEYSKGNGFSIDELPVNVPKKQGR